MNLKRINLKKMNLKKIISIIIYIIGICCVIFYACSAIIGGNHVSNPDAMIPYTDFEANFIILAIGCVPMIASCFFVIDSYQIKRRLHKFLILVPGIITAIPFVFVIGFLIFLWFLAWLDVMGIR